MHLRTVSWTLVTIFVLIVGLAVLGAVIGTDKKAAKPRGVPVAAAKANVVVTNIGFSDDTKGSKSDIRYGVVVVNRSRGLDALDVTVTVSALDKQGRSVSTDKPVITVIPAGDTFVVAGEMLPRISLRISGLRAGVSVGNTKSKGLRLPVLSNVRLDTSGGTLLDVKGQVRNPYQTPLSQNAQIYAVFINHQGQIVGSTTGLTGAAIKPNATLPFDIVGVVNNRSAKPTSTWVSVDPCGLSGATLGTCRAPS